MSRLSVYARKERSRQKRYEMKLCRAVVLFNPITACKCAGIYYFAFACSFICALFFFARDLAKVPPATPIFLDILITALAR